NPKCLEYIVVHEMVHLLERYHNKRFYAFMDQYLPDWKEIREELKSIGSLA
ncbi:MAG: M48 family metallopeptidase, partial [Lutispora sp.]